MKPKTKDKALELRKIKRRIIAQIHPMAVNYFISDFEKALLIARQEAKQELWDDIQKSNITSRELKKKHNLKG